LLGLGQLPLGKNNALGAVVQVRGIVHVEIMNCVQSWMLIFLGGIIVSDIFWHHNNRMWNDK
jgi:hypothetical protein